MTERENTRRKSVLTPEQEERQARQFGEWQTQSRRRRGLNMPALADITGYSDSHIRMFDMEARGGYDSEGKYRQPTEKYIQAVAKATGAPLQAGLIAAGRMRHEAGRVLIAGVPYEIINPDGTVQEIMMTDEDIAFFLAFRAEREKRRN